METRFITFEGGEGSGKTTQVKRLAARLRETGHEVITTREPGGTEMAERIRALLVTGEIDALSSTAEALLNYAARDDHLRRLIRPALAAGKVVISDRFMDSTRAYQALAGTCPMALVDAMETHVVGDTRPGLTLILDIEPEIGLARAHRRLAGSGDRQADKGNAESRFERFGLDFHRRLREAYLAIAQAEPERCVVVDAARDPDVVAAEIWRVVQARLAGDRAREV